MKTNFFTVLSLILFSTQSLWAQNRPIVVTGIVVEQSSQQPLEFATVKLVNPETDDLIAGTATGLDGSFTLESKTPAFAIQFDFIGFQTLVVADFTPEKGRVDLGLVSLSEDAEMLDEVVVSAEKSQTTFQLDKRVFNVGQDLSSTGASALEVLNNVPSVNVNIEGQISLRGSSGVQILINGKPSILASEEGNALGTITADMIEKVEVITNPSAKYEAEGTSGIINIVLKKEEKKGINGSITLNTGWPQNHSVGLSVNRRTEKFNLFSQFGVGYRSLPRFRESVNTNLLSGTSITSDGVEFRNEQFYNVILGADYHLNKYNVITLSGNFAYEAESQPSTFAFQELDATGNVITEWEREEVTTAGNPKLQYELQYKKDFKDDKEHTLLFSALGRFFGKDLESQFDNQVIQGDLTFDDQLTATQFQEGNFTFKADYTKPFNDKWTLETGAQYVIQDVSNNFEVKDLVGGEFVSNPDFTNQFDYNQKVLGLYTTGAYEGDRWGIKAGLRVENTDLSTLLVTTNQPNNQNFTNLFPSAHTSYKVNERLSFQAGYSRRIFRPRLWDLNPFFNIRNNFNIRMGNPNLLPEFTDSYEVNGIYILDKISMNLGVYQRYTSEVIERISFFEDGVTVTMPVNIGTNQATGVEFNTKYSPAKWLTMNGDFNYRYFQREGSLEGTVFDFAADVWDARITTKWKLPAKFDLEVTGRYESAEQMIQGVRSAQLFADLGVRKKIWKGKAVVNLSVRDIFASRIWEMTTVQETFEVYSRSLRGRFITLGFSYGFGKGEAMTYGGGRRRW
ncbi:MAG: TonB-dependent receptor [Bacteroidota bacterium]